MIDHDGLAFHPVDVRLEHLQCVGVDHRPHIGRQQTGVTDVELRHGATQHLDELVRDVVLDVQHA